MNTKRILKRIGKENNVSVKEVEREIKEVIMISRQSEAPFARRLWSDIGCERDIDLHTIERFLKACSGMVCSEKN